MIHKLYNPLNDCELKFSESDGTFTGYASVFGGNDSYNDTIEKGAFAKTLEGRSRAPLMLYGHNPGRVIGKWVELKEDENGLMAKGEFTPGNTDAQNVYASLKHGALDGLSIGFRIPKGGADKKEDGGRIIKEIDLVEISVVSMPADSDARVSVVKAEIESIESLKDAELFLRDSGAFSRAAATAFVSRINELHQCDTVKHLQDEITRLEQKLRGENAITDLIEKIRKL